MDSIVRCRQVWAGVDRCGYSEQMLTGINRNDREVNVNSVAGMGCTRTDSVNRQGQVWKDPGF